VGRGRVRQRALYVASPTPCLPGYTGYHIIWLIDLDSASLLGSCVLPSPRGPRWSIPSLQSSLPQLRDRPRDHAPGPLHLEVRRCNDNAISI
jgi:hypothetical protein